jgi:hypothetical protein
MAAVAGTRFPQLFSAREFCPAWRSPPAQFRTGQSVPVPTPLRSQEPNALPNVCTSLQMSATVMKPWDRESSQSLAYSFTRERITDLTDNSEKEDSLARKLRALQLAYLTLGSLKLPFLQLRVLGHGTIAA